MNFAFGATLISEPLRKMQPGDEFETAAIARGWLTGQTGGEFDRRPGDGSSGAEIANLQVVDLSLEVASIAASCEQMAASNGCRTGILLLKPPSNVSGVALRSGNAAGPEPLLRGFDSRNRGPALG